MRIVLHGGLHKSGTTSIQAAWCRAYADHATAWYPPPSSGPPGHHRLARPLLDAFLNATDPDLVGASTAFRLRGGTTRETLPGVIAEAEARRVEVLVLSSEELDRVRPGDRGRLVEALDGHDVTLALTVTRPVHRWCAGWQTLVRRGLQQYPAECADIILDFAALRAGRLQEIVDAIPARRRMVRLVRTSPPEPALPLDLAVALGLPPFEVGAADHVSNRSLGIDTEVVLRINRSGQAVGSDQAGRAVLTRLKGSGFDYREVPERRALYALPHALSAAAASEEAWLRSLGGRDPQQWQLVDPHGVLDTWQDATLPGWYDEVSGREAVVPELESVMDPREQLWRLRQEVGAYRKQAGGGSPSRGARGRPGRL